MLNDKNLKKKLKFKCQNESLIWRFIFFFFCVKKCQNLVSFFIKQKNLEKQEKKNKPVTGLLNKNWFLQIYVFGKSNRSDCKLLLVFGESWKFIFISIEFKFFSTVPAVQPWQVSLSGFRLKLPLIKINWNCFFFIVRCVLRFSMWKLFEFCKCFIFCNYCIIPTFVYCVFFRNNFKINFK